MAYSDSSILIISASKAGRYTPGMPLNTVSFHTPPIGGGLRELIRTEEKIYYGNSTPAQRAVSL